MCTKVAGRAATTIISAILPHNLVLGNVLPHQLYENPYIIIASRGG